MGGNDKIIYMAQDMGPQKISFLMKPAPSVEQKPAIKPPAYAWQDLALELIKELQVPGFKRNSMFKVCKDNTRELVEKARNETKELCTSGEKWKYFFKVVDSLKNNRVATPEQQQVNLLNYIKQQKKFKKELPK